MFVLSRMGYMYKMGRSLVKGIRVNFTYIIQNLKKREALERMGL